MRADVRRYGYGYALKSNLFLFLRCIKSDGKIKIKAIAIQLDRII